MWACVLFVLSDTGQVWVVQAIMCFCDARGELQGQSCDMAASISPLGPAGCEAMIHKGLDYSVKKT